jgi:hypothetical protein
MAIPTTVDPSVRKEIELGSVTHWPSRPSRSNIMKTTDARAILAVALLALLALAGGGFCANKAKDPAAQAVQYIESLGGSVTRDEKAKGKPVVEVDLELGDEVIGVQHLNRLAAIRSLRTLNLSGPNMTDARLKELAGLKGLETLNLRHTEVTDEGMKDLAKMQALQELDVSWTKVTDAALKDLADLPALQKLDLRENKVTDAGLKDLAGLKTLQTLNLSSTGVTDAGLKDLAGLPTLQNLALWKTGVTRAGIKRLQEALPDCKIVSDFKTGTTRAFDKGNTSDAEVAPNPLLPATKLSTIPAGCTVVFNGTKAFLRDASGGRKPMPDGDYQLPNGGFVSVRGHERVPGAGQMPATPIPKQ